jgi:hypothetical protein
MRLCERLLRVCYGPSRIAWPVLGGLAGRPFCELMGFGLALPGAGETDWGFAGEGANVVVGAGQTSRGGPNVAVGRVGSGHSLQRRNYFTFATAPRESHGLCLVALLAGRSANCGVLVSRCRGRGRLAGGWGWWIERTVAGSAYCGCQCHRLGCRAVVSGRPGWVSGWRRADSYCACRSADLTNMRCVARRHPRIPGVT